MKIEEEREVTRTQETVVGIKCDGCGKTEGGDDPSGWYEFDSSHLGWGADSADSEDTYDVCSAECYFKMLAFGLKDVGNYVGGEIDGKSAEFAEKIVDYVGALTKGKE